MKASSIDLHIEISGLRNFVNDQINSGNPYAFDGKDFYEVLKRVVIDAEVKPFLTPPKSESEQNYYEKYRSQSREGFYKLIPDFFEYEGDFYDLDRVQYAHKDFTIAEDFEKLFMIKLLELKSINYPIGEFLSFQQFDSFYGQKESIDSFIYQLTEKDSNCHLLQDLCEALRDWIDSKNLELLMQSSVEIQDSEVDNDLNEKFDSQAQWEKDIESLSGKQVKCKWSIEQIVHYFSFLYEEKSDKGEPYLKKEQVEQIFKNGFRIPEKPIEPLFKLNYSLRFPVKNVTYAIYYFYDRANERSHDKLAYILFFASYIEDYSKCISTKKDYKTFSNNSYKAPSRNKINWDKYRPN